MKNISLKTLIFSFFIFFIFIGCQEDSLPNGMKKVHWDRDICERCKMIISERKFTVQMINPKTNEAFMFDDLGCAVLWFIEDEIAWFNEANVYITDAVSGKWIDAKEAIYVSDTLTPMGYGLSAYSKQTIVENSTHLNYEQAVEKIKQIDHAQKSKRQGSYTHP
ncbi:MAG: nitrous oxide reductase accessory protein NosL [Arcobacteraceae bacterium]